MVVALALGALGAPVAASQVPVIVEVPSAESPGQDPAPGDPTEDPDTAEPAPGPRLPITGHGILMLVLAGLACVVAGVILLGFTRRERRRGGTYEAV